MCTQGRKHLTRTIKSLIKNHPSKVYDSLLGYALVNKNLIVLENHCIIMRRDYSSMKGKVKIIGGGGAGIEPAEAFYVGKGMLTAAVVGDVFTSPSAHEILIAIRELAVDNPDGILLLVKNYIGDTLNFTLAMDQAVSENILVRMLVIEDDIFNHSPSKYGRKGMAGSVLIYKIAGEMAEQGKLLEDIINECKNNILSYLVTASATLVPCNITACEILNSTLFNDEILLGVGIYGKGGVRKVKNTDLKEVVSVVLKEIECFCDKKSVTLESEIIVLVNNFGNMTKLEEAVISYEVSEQLQNKFGFKIHKLMMGTYMSSMGTQGFSVSLLKSTPEILYYLNSPTSASGWPGAYTNEFNMEYIDLPITLSCSALHEHSNNKSALNCQSLVHGPVLSEKATAALEQIILFAAEALISCEKQLNIINAEAGDGDTGTVFRRGADSIKEAVLNHKMTLNIPFKFLNDLSEICSKSMAGLSGALYSVFFKAAAKVFQSSVELTPELCCTAFKEAIKALKHYGNVELGERTVLDVLYPAFESFENALKHDKNLTAAVHLAAITCEFKAEETKWIRPYTFEYTSINLPLLYADAGAHAATIWLRAVSEGLKLHYPTDCL